MRNWYRYSLRPAVARRVEKIVMGIAWRLPRRLVMWCYYRVLADYTHREPTAVVPEIRAMDAVKEWAT